MERGMKLDKTIEFKTVFLSWRQTMRDSYIHQDSRAKAQLVTRIFDTCLSFSLSFVHFSCSSWTADTAEAVSSRVGSALIPKRMVDHSIGTAWQRREWEAWRRVVLESLLVVYVCLSSLSLIDAKGECLY